MPLHVIFVAARSSKHFPSGKNPCLACEFRKAPIIILNLILQYLCGKAVSLCRRMVTMLCLHDQTKVCVDFRKHSPSHLINPLTWHTRPTYKFLDSPQSGLVSILASVGESYILLIHCHLRNMTRNRIHQVPATFGVVVEH